MLTAHLSLEKENINYKMRGRAEKTFGKRKLWLETKIENREEKAWKHLETINFGNVRVKGDSLSRQTSETETGQRRIFLKSRNVSNADQMTICLKFWSN